ncbi:MULTISPECIES: ATP-dependent DNA helicase RecG [Mycolicibacterium]|jgi:ATP-dependent DNA helicase RecG|uniref:ATP-dependent DNA helicase RecG n=1 Tax=Mycolicibacterium vanbaalenii (strain DSM 7251 / JCM 13017 / BCRC 16820 / KCTC 9966 / NRRL B-24157 / PYR-1) TaxID=350058 RepID=A1T720_MYCVP|nr:MULTISPECIES: ATP-dependent DNA helicase RecG [Mycolicibacterium]ABM12970.1 ATP-dependent DNA helicase RecG [Mycolicibacterium vanbaalenii PYR-1]MCV7125974.1 ATP-dependent DNA helicase RecG [Mycolicibacterium vanbaalenii PYR-1]QZT58947.1 ATP-dependent DNA helicase RecG [Mycolicibacterium austroafricanum]QZY48206.1 ATP-dependent DNA helicase RecG [Mycolicibacterium austroafricanum]
MAKLDDSLHFVLGKKAADNLEEHLGLRTVNDLLRYFPRKYSDAMTVRGEGEDLEVGEHVTFVDVIDAAELKRVRNQPSREFLVVTLRDRRPKVTATFFNPKYLKNTLVEGAKVMLSGEVGYYRGTMQLTHPAFMVLNSASGKKIGTKSLTSVASTTDATGDELLAEFEKDYFPIYGATAKVQTWDIYACVRQMLAVLDPVPETLPEWFVREHNLMSEDEALRAVHLSENAEDRDRAIERLTFDEAVGLQWGLVVRRHSELSASGPPAKRRGDGLMAAMMAQLPFELTTGQREVLEVISAELSAPRPMNRMLQGEVGSGKTVVSLLAMLQMIDAGYQCALLAPTEVLAAQHALSIRSMLGPLATAGELGGADNATRVALLTGSMTAQQKRDARREVASGEAGIVIGTHALLQDTVEFDNLGMVVVDEQHRFGVEQRDRLRAKAPEGITPHLLVMTATPIPRTVALTIYGDLETSILRELPRGRQPITTNTIFQTQKPAWLERAWARIAEEVKAGRQAYVVASRIDEDDKPSDEDKKDDGKAKKAKKATKEQGPPPVTVVEMFARLQRGLLSDLRLGLMHGRLSGDEKAAVMSAFRRGEIDVLVCTTVIEVGVDVPNATVMVVMDADRFGISQLHQLRGRIGRGEHPSLCLLVTKLPESSKAGQRLKAVAGTLDGFALADLDLRERSEGDVLGYYQSGRPITLRFLSLAEHLEIILAAKELCETVYESDPLNPGMATLSAPFVDTDRVQFLDMS